MTTKFAGHRKVVIVALALTAMVGADSAVRAAWLWSTVGSAGIVDEADTGIVMLGGSEALIPPLLSQDFGGTVSIRGTAPLPATLNMRYNVGLTSAEVSGYFGWRLRVRYVDNGPGARVIVRMKRYNAATGVMSTWTEFDSDAFPPQGPSGSCPFCPITNLGFQRQEGPCAGGFLPLLSSSYFIDAELIKTTADGTPMLGIVELEPCGS